MFEDHKNCILPAQESDNADNTDKQKNSNVEDDQACDGIPAAYFKFNVVNKRICHNLRKMIAFFLPVFD